MKGKDRPAEIQQKMLENRTGYTELRKGIDHVLQMSKMRCLSIMLKWKA